MCRRGVRARLGREGVFGPRPKPPSWLQAQQAMKKIEDIAACATRRGDVQKRMDVFYAAWARVAARMIANATDTPLRDEQAETFGKPARRKSRQPCDVAGLPADPEVRQADSIAKFLGMAATWRCAAAARAAGMGGATD